jgi:hypothetical protein
MTIKTVYYNKKKYKTNVSLYIYEEREYLINDKKSLLFNSYSCEAVAIITNINGNNIAVQWLNEWEHNKIQKHIPWETIDNELHNVLMDVPLEIWEIIFIFVRYNVWFTKQEINNDTFELIRKHALPLNNAKPGDIVCLWNIKGRDMLSPFCFRRSTSETFMRVKSVKSDRLILDALCFPKHNWNTNYVELGPFSSGYVNWTNLSGEWDFFMLDEKIYRRQMIIYYICGKGIKHSEGVVNFPAYKGVRWSQNKYGERHNIPEISEKGLKKWFIESDILDCPLKWTTNMWKENRKERMNAMEFWNNQGGSQLYKLIPENIKNCLFQDYKFNGINDTLLSKLPYVRNRRRFCNTPTKCPPQLLSVDYIYDIKSESNNNNDRWVQNNRRLTRTFAIDNSDEFYINTGCIVSRGLSDEFKLMRQDKLKHMSFENGKNYGFISE